MKIGRHAKIVDLIGKYDIETQEELAEHHKREAALLACAISAT